MMLTYDFFGRSIHENKLVFDHITCVFQDVWCHHPASLKTSPRSQKCFYGICLPWLSLLVTLPWVCSHFMIINHCKICTISVGEPAVWACQLWFQLCQVTIFSGYATAAVNHVNATVSVSDCMTRTTSCCFDVFPSGVVIVTLIVFWQLAVVIWFVCFKGVGQYLLWYLWLEKNLCRKQMLKMVP